jgi:hypothetical protein
MNMAFVALSETGDALGPCTMKMVFVALSETGDALVIP